MARAILAFLVTFLVGCADLKAVREYGALGKGVAASFPPLVEESTLRCREIFEYSDIASRRYDPRKSSDEGKAACEQNVDASKAMVELSNLVGNYHDALIKIAGGDVAGSLGGDYTRLGASIKGLKIDGVAVAPAAKVDAIAAVGAWVTKVALANWQHREITGALSIHREVGDIADILVVYVERNYGAYSTQALRQADEAQRAIAAREAQCTIATPCSDPYGANLLRRELYQRAEMLKERQQLVTVYRSATDKMKVALATLAASGGELKSREELRSLWDLSVEVRDLYKKVAAAY